MISVVVTTPIVAARIRQERVNVRFGQALPVPRDSMLTGQTVPTTEFLDGMRVYSARSSSLLPSTDKTQVVLSGLFNVRMLSLIGMAGANMLPAVLGSSSAILAYNSATGNVTLSTVAVTGLAPTLRTLLGSSSVITVEARYTLAGGES